MKWLDKWRSTGGMNHAQAPTEVRPGSPALHEYVEIRQLDLVGRLRLFDEVCNLVQSMHEVGAYYHSLDRQSVVVHESEGARTVEIKCENRPIASPRALPAGALSGRQLAAAVDVWQLGGILADLVQGCKPIPVLMQEVVDHATAIGSRRFRDVAELRSAVVGVARGMVAAATLSRRGEWLAPTEETSRLERGLTPLPV